MKVIENFNPTIFKNIKVIIPEMNYLPTIIELTSDGRELRAVSYEYEDLWKQKFENPDNLKRGHILGDFYFWKVKRYIIFEDLDQNKSDEHLYKEIVKKTDLYKKYKEGGEESFYTNFHTCFYEMNSYFKDDEVRDFLEEIL